MRAAACLILISCVFLGWTDFISNWRSVGLYLALFALQAGCLMWVWKTKPAPSLRFVLISALLFRLALLPAGLREDWHPQDLLDPDAWQRFLLFDHDVWRFLWDPHVTAAGINPYRFSPTDAALDSLAEVEPWVSVRSKINYPQTPTTYPPGAQLLFRISHELLPANPLGMKLLAIAADLAITALLPQSGRLLYAWNPLVLKAGAASAHFDSVLALFLLALLIHRQHVWKSAAWLGAATLLKLSPLALLPWLFRQSGTGAVLIAAGIAALGFSPFLPEILQGLAAFGGNWKFNAGYFGLLEWLIPLAARPLSALTFLAAIVALLRSKRLNPAQQAAWIMFLAVVLSPVVMPWYLVWCLPLAIVAGESIPIYFSFAVALSTLVMVDGLERPWWLWLEHLPLFLAISLRFAVTFQREPTILVHGHDIISDDTPRSG